MTPFLSRPPEERALFNPAFIAWLLYAASREHEKAVQRPLPVPYLYVVTAVALHGRSRRTLPSNSATQMHAWTRDNVRVLVGLARRAVALRPLVSDATCVALRHGVLLSAPGGVLPGVIRRRRRGTPITPEVEECLSAAGFLGRWFSRQPDPDTALALWGLRV